MREIAKPIAADVKAAYSGSPIGVVSGALRGSVRISAGRKGFKVYIVNRSPTLSVGGMILTKDGMKTVERRGAGRRHVARFLEEGTVKMRARPVWESIYQRYAPGIAKQLLDAVMQGYKQS